VQPGTRQKKECGGAKNLETVADQDHLAPVEAICNVAGGKEKNQSGQKQRQACIPKVNGAVGDGVYLPGYGYRLRLGSKDSRDAG
jgi:hypothetical protein